MRQTDTATDAGPAPDLALELFIAVLDAALRSILGGVVGPPDSSRSSDRVAV
jgi:hypothetical protein